MRINEIFEELLPEAKEYIDTEMYGGWLNSKGEVHQVDYEGHVDWVRDRYGEPDESEDDDGFLEYVMLNTGKLYDIAFNNNWVRFVVEERFNSEGAYGLNLQGHWNDIRKSFRYWWPTAMNAENIHIESYHVKNGKKQRKGNSFAMPKDRTKLIAVIKEVNESASGGSISAGSIASVANPLRGMGLQKRPSIFGYAAPTKKKKKKKK